MGTKTLLDGVNDVLTRVRVIRSSSLFSSLTDSARQSYIDIAVQIWNESISEIYSASQKEMPSKVGSSLITLVAGTRAYSVTPTDLTLLRFPLKDETNGNYIWEYPGGFEAMNIDQSIPGDYTGQPMAAAIRPTDGKIYLDRIPTASENGDVYSYFYDKEVLMSVAADVYPFSDEVYTALVPAVAQLWKRDQRRDFDPEIYRMNIGRAAAMLSQVPARKSWLPSRGSSSGMDPYNE